MYILKINSIKYKKFLKAKMFFIVEATWTRTFSEKMETFSYNDDILAFYSVFHWLVKKLNAPF